MRYRGRTAAPLILSLISFEATCAFALQPATGVTSGQSTEQVVARHASPSAQASHWARGSAITAIRGDGEAGAGVIRK